MKPALLPIFLFIAGLAGLPAFPASGAATENGVRWLRSELPPTIRLESVDGEQLAAAVGRATLAHPPEAAAILRAALTRGVKQLKRGQGGVLPCASAKRVLSVSVAAVPAQASALLDLATELYPACAAELAEVLRDYDRVDYDYKDRVSDKNVVDAPAVPARGTTVAPSDPPGARPEQPTFDPGSDIGARGDLSDLDVAGLGYGGTTGLEANGVGAGFPGSPGFIGSAPGGGFALPPAPLTAAVNG